MKWLHATSGLVAAIMASDSVGTRLGRGLLALLALCATQVPAASAQDAGAPPDDSGEFAEESEIIVSGTAEDKARARNYVSALQAASFNLQAARWTDSICIGVSGTTRPIAERLAGRINSAANTIGARLDKPSCKPNLLVVFTRDAAAYMAKLRRDSATRLAEIPASREGFVFGKQAPIRWWYNTGVLGSDGRPLNAGATGMTGCAGPCAMPSLGQNVRSQSTYSSSRIQNPTIRQIKSAVVVIDLQLAAGRAIDSLGDYAALVSLAEVWPSDSAVPGGTILGLFRTPPADGSDMPLLTAMDERFLCQLYSMPLARSGGYHEALLMRAVSASGETCFDRARAAAEPATAAPTAATGG